MRQQKLKIQDLEKVNKDMMKVMHTVFPRSSDPFYIVKLLYKMGHYFLDRQYVGRTREGELEDNMFR